MPSAEQKKQNFWTTEYGALILLGISAILYSLQGVATKYASDDGNGYTVAEIFFTRAIVQVLVCLASLYKTKTPLIPSDSYLRKLTLVRGMFGCFGFIFYYKTLLSLPLGDAIALVSIYPVFSAIAAWYFLNEQLSILHVGSLISCLIGTFLIAQPTFIFPEPLWGEQKVDKIGYITAIGAMIIMVLILIIVRKAKNVKAMQLMLSFSFFGFVLGLIFIIAQQSKFQGPKLPLFFVCFFAIPGHFLLNYAARFAPVGPASIVRSSDIIFAYIWQVIFFHQDVNPFTILGIMGVLISVWMVGLSKLACCKKDKINFETLEESDSGEVELGKLSPAPSPTGTSRPLKQASVEMLRVDGDSRNYDPFDDYKPSLIVSQELDAELGSGSDADDLQEAKI